ncbi:uncharacterized protein LOC110688575 [Chenopodium quinoa]|uniref:uncharacterized protein LOC110688575 n=1 Tax=Chenopodium quinoa TaxID=63459 RepID=UPI000B76DDDC|nr:uncharacterized protein LOC110688575 [Chenopodium quinoa]
MALLRSIIVLILLNSSLLVVKVKTLNNGPSDLMVPEPRKFGHHGANKSQHSNAPSVSPSQAPESSHNSVKNHHENASSSNDETTNAHGEELSPHQEVHLENVHAHHHTDKSVAGGGVIIGCLATAFVLSIFCYIRATRRTQQQIMSKEQLI